LGLLAIEVKEGRIILNGPAVLNHHHVLVIPADQVLKRMHEAVQLAGSDGFVVAVVELGNPLFPEALKGREIIAQPRGSRG
jgi:hypothetical protein